MAEQLRDQLPQEWRSMTFLQGVKWCAGLAAAISLDSRNDRDTSEQAMSRLAILLHKIVSEYDA